MDAPRFQFSIRRLLGVTAIVAAAIGALAAEPGPVSGASLILLVCVFPAVLAAGLVRKPGYWRAFCAGAILPAGFAFYQTDLHHSIGFCLLETEPGIANKLQSVATNPDLRSDIAHFWIPMLLVGLMSAGFYRVLPGRSFEGSERQPRAMPCSVQAILWLIIAAGAAIGALSADPNRYAGSAMVLLVLAFPVALAAGLVGNRGGVKAFCAGAIIPAGAAMYDTVGHYFTPLYSLAEIPLILDMFEKMMTNSSLRPHVGLLWTGMLVMGLASAGVFWASGDDRSGDT